MPTQANISCACKSLIQLSADKVGRQRPQGQPTRRAWVKDRRSDVFKNIGNLKKHFELRTPIANEFMPMRESTRRTEKLTLSSRKKSSHETTAMK